MRPLPYLRWAGRPTSVVFVLEQLWVNDDQTAWEWRPVETVDVPAVMKGEGPPPIYGDRNKESHHE